MTIDRAETLADLQATVDYVASITEQSDSFEFDLAAELCDALGRVAKAVEAAQGMLTGQMLSRLEAGGPRVFGHERFERTRKYTERTDHETVMKAVYEEAGASSTPMEAAIYATHLMEKVYLSKSVVARKGEIDKLGVARSAVYAKEYTGWKVERSEIPDDHA